MVKHILDKMKLPFQKERELRLSLYNILGFYPHHIALYKQALLHKSVMRRNANGRPMNNERLEFLGDAILSAIVGDIVYEHFPGKREGFLTNTRSKLVQREMLNKLASEMGINRMILSNGHSFAHNSYMGGNAFEALIGAIYLDRGYDACMRFIKKRILANLVNIDTVAEKEVNFKSRLLEYCQKRKFDIEYRMLDTKLDDDGSPMFVFEAAIEGIACGTGEGYSKKESQQKASKAAIQTLKNNQRLFNQLKEKQSARNQEPEETVVEQPVEEKPKQKAAKRPAKAKQEKAEPAVAPVSAEETIAAAETEMATEMPAATVEEQTAAPAPKSTTEAEEKKPKRRTSSRKKAASDDSQSAPAAEKKTTRRKTTKAKDETEKAPEAEKKTNRRKTNRTKKEKQTAEE